MNILCIGDVVGEAGLDFFCDRIPGLKRDLAADFVIVNGENSDKSGTGITRNGAARLLEHADVVTGGNHSLRRTGLESYTEQERLLLPANYPFVEDAAGCCVVDTGRLGAVRVINLAGVAWMEPIDNPFGRVEDLLAWDGGQQAPVRFTVVDFHAESTAEKKALAFYLDGRVGAVFGTHTHVQTADEQVLPKGTGFISDVGMTGPALSVLGMEPEAAVTRQRSHVPVQFRPAEGPCMLNGALFKLDDTSGLCTAVERVGLWEGTPP